MEEIEVPATHSYNGHVDQLACSSEIDSSRCSSEIDSTIPSQSISRHLGI